MTRVRRFRVDIIVSGSVRSKEKHLLIHVLSPYTYDVYYNKCSTGQTGDLFMYLKFRSFRINWFFFIVIGLCWKSKSFQVKYKVKRDEKFKQNIKPLSRIVCVRSCIWEVRCCRPAACFRSLSWICSMHLKFYICIVWTLYLYCLKHYIIPQTNCKRLKNLTRAFSWCFLLKWH